MTGTAVKNAAAIVPNMALNTAKSAKGAAVSGSSDFQSVWNNQMGKNAQNTLKSQDSALKPATGSEKPGSEKTSSEKPGSEKLSSEKTEQSVAGRDETGPQKTGENLKTSANEQQSVKTDKASGEQPEQTGDLNPEELEKAMETLGTAVMELMQEIADTFGISMEELQGTLEELGMEPMDLLQPEGLGQIALKLGGAQDSLALLTDETLCGRYKAFLGQMTEILHETAEDLKVDPGQLEMLLNGKQTQIAQGAETASGDGAAVEAVSGDRALAEMVSGDKNLAETVSGDRNLNEAVSGEKTYAETAPGEMVSARKIPDRPEEDGLLENGGQKTSDAMAEDGLRIQVNKPDGAGDKRESEKQPERESDGGQQGNLLAQEFRTQQPDAGVQQTQNAAQSALADADTQNIMRQIMDYMKLQLNADTTNLEMHLHPESLGTLHVQVEAKAGVITASFITQNEAVKAALESQIVQLKESFEEQGVKVEAIEVMVQSHAFERNLEQGREQNQGNSEPSKKARVRRINLNDLPAMDDMEAEDALAADMLAAGGSTVDYTA